MTVVLGPSDPPTASPRALRPTILEMAAEAAPPAALPALKVAASRPQRSSAAARPLSLSRARSHLRDHCATAGLGDGAPRGRSRPALKEHALWNKAPFLDDPRRALDAFINGKNRNEAAKTRFDAI